MSEKMSYAEWNDACVELDSIRSQARQAGLCNLDEVLEVVEMSLTVDECPAVAALELDFLAGQLRRCPKLQKAMRALSRRLSLYPAVEVRLLH